MICIIILFYSLKFTIAGEHQRRLLKYLLEENQHNPLERPVYNDSHTLIVTMNLALQQIIDFDEKNEILVCSGWLVLTWYDYSLQWKPEDFGNIQTIRLPSTRVWTPDIILYNSADDNFEGTIKTNLVVQSNGSILFVPPGIFKSICTFNIASFPFIRRRTLYYVINIVVPCVLISFMTVLGFLLPPDSGEKLTLQITILLSIVMFSLLISGIIPASSTALPTIVTYFTTLMCMCTMSVVATVVVLALHHRNAKNHTMPIWIRVYINQYLAWFLHMKRPGHDLSWRAIRHRRFRQNEKLNTNHSMTLNNNYKLPSTPLLENSSKSLLANITNTDDQLYVPMFNHIRSCTSNSDTKEPLQPCDMNYLRSNIHSILSELKCMADYIRREEEEDDISQDWKFSAMVIDRLCLISFTIMTTIFTYLTLFSAPNFFQLR
ncbi:unnamed protein product [Adineta ricciae]|uniref:Uncharacterized protein n=1 Tax=Adineta ricciae TaxID=249248 RepID=A0A815BCT4_ADIRI|nr:unnamed protein product [Adineta ricciae]